jgi:hypothetical protein
MRTAVMSRLTHVVDIGANHCIGLEINGYLPAEF